MADTFLSRNELQIGDRIAPMPGQRTDMYLRVARLLERKNDGGYLYELELIRELKGDSDGPMAED